MQIQRTLTRLLPLAAGAMMASTALAQSTGLEDMVGARAGQAENGVQARGYRWVRTEKGDDRSYAYWWSDRRQQCVTIATMDGRYASVTPTLPPDCRQKARPGSGHTPPPRPVYGRDSSYGSDYPPPHLGYATTLPAPGVGAGPVVVGGYQVDLGLVCFGDGRRPRLSTRYQWTWDSRRDRYTYGNSTELGAEYVDASLMIQLWPGGGRIRLPRSLIPPINSRGNDGWWDLYDVSAGPDMITAKYRLNGLNKPSVRIDRRSGQITVEGTSPYQFRGTCDLLDGRDQRRF